MRFEKKRIRKKRDLKKEKFEDLFVVKFRRIILTAILKKELYMMKRFPQRRLTKSVNAKNLQIAIRTIYFFQISTLKNV